VQEVISFVQISSTRPRSATATGQSHSFIYNASSDSAGLDLKVFFGDGSSQNLTNANGTRVCRTVYVYVAF